MTTKRQIREVAKIICHNASGVCVMVLNPDRPKCTEKNCRMMTIARKTLRVGSIMAEVETYSDR